MNITKITKQVFSKVKETNPELSLDELLFKVYNQIKEYTDEPFDSVRTLILKANNIDEFEYYTKKVNPELIKYVEDKIFPEYEKNDKAHGVIHIIEVIRRSFALNETLKLKLNPDIIFTIAAYHDLGKYIDHENHEKIAADLFMKDEFIKNIFSNEERTIIKEAIEDHRSSLADIPRTAYGKLISSADRNTRIEIVFIRSFFVAKVRMPDMNIEEYLDYTLKRLSKKYSEENPENMFYEDETYKVFLKDMRYLLKNETEFKNRYCKVNNISSRNNKVSDEEGEIKYTRKLKNKILVN